MDITKFQGVIPAFYACYDEKGEVSTAAVEELTRFFVKKGVKGIYVGGVKAPLANLVEADATVVDEAAAMIDAAVKKYI